MGRVKDRSVRPFITREAFWTIMSMLMSARATISKIFAARPIESGMPAIVIFASERSWQTPEMIASSMSGIDASLSSSESETSMTHVPGLSEKDERTCTRTSSRRAYSTQRRCSTFAPEAAVSSISSYEMDGMPRAPGTIRGSAVKMPSTSV